MFIELTEVNGRKVVVNSLATVENLPPEAALEEILRMLEIEVSE